MRAYSPIGGWGPGAKRAALCLTFDNFGEACELEVGVWGGKSVGQHYTADFVPVLIEALGDARGTYFIEASNVELYPDAIKSWHRSGNEVAMHAWRHEFWAKCDAPRRRDILKRSIAAMNTIGIAPQGFRPPGGEVPPEVWQEFKEAGLVYCSDISPLGIRVIDDMLSLPFTWQAVDAYYFEDIAAPLRVKFGHQEAAYGPDYWAHVLAELEARIVDEATQATVIFHPHLLASDSLKLAVFKDFVRNVGRNRDIWVARAGDLARFVMDEVRRQEAVA